jgi:hypothetical protein
VARTGFIRTCGIDDEEGLAFAEHLYALYAEKYRSRLFAISRSPTLRHKFCMDTAASLPKFEAVMPRDDALGMDCV